jgi:hypothetical protein
MTTIGEKETVHSPSFLARNAKRRGYTKSKCPIEKYEWAELKSSILMKELTKNNGIQYELVEYCQKIVVSIFDSLKIGLRGEMNYYMEELKSATQQDSVYNYPIGQSTAWKGDKDGLWNNFYALYNFLKWTWSNLNRRVYNNASYDQESINKSFIIEMFQQQMIAFLGSIRGDRLDGMFAKKTDQIGISTLKVPYLKHNVLGKPDYKVEPWFHSGETLCRVPYHGKYGSYMKQYKENDDYYASLQCGISGSTQYIMFLYLMSIAETGTDDADRDVRNTILSASSVLTGDGGHNIREVLFGLTCSVIILHNFINDLTVEIQNIFKNKLSIKENMVFVTKYIDMVLNTSIKTRDDGNLLSKIVMYILNNFNRLLLFHKVQNQYEIIKTIFLYLINTCGSWSIFISTFYKHTKNLNIVGVYKQDLDTFNTSITKDTDISFKITKKIFYDLFFSIDKDMFGEEYHTTSQIFFALDNKRYLMNPDESFKHSANNVLEKIIKTFPEDEGNNVLEKVNMRLKEHLKKCNLSIKKSDIIPFAFCETKKKKSTKK